MTDPLKGVGEDLGPLRTIARRYPQRLAHLDEDTQIQVFAAVQKCANAVSDLMNRPEVRESVDSVAKLGSIANGTAGVLVAIERLRQADEHLLIELAAHDPNARHPAFVRYIKGVSMEDL